MGGCLQEGGSGSGKPRPLLGGIEVCRPGAVSRQDGFFEEVKGTQASLLVHLLNLSYYLLLILMFLFFTVNINYQFFSSNEGKTSEI